MLVALLAVAFAGPPYLGCTESGGELFFVSPADGRVLQIVGDSAKTIGKVERKDGSYKAILAPAPNGGWYVGSHGTYHHLAPDGTVTPADKPEPRSLFEVLGRETAAFEHDGAVITHQKDDNGGTVYRTEADASQTRLWSFDHWAKTPLGYFAQGSTIYAITQQGIVIHPEDGNQTVLPEPGHDTLGVCKTADGPLHAMTISGRAATTCMHRWENDAWKQLFCLD